MGTNCKFTDEELSAYADGEVERQRMPLIEQHLCECSDCREKVKAFQSLGSAFSMAAPIDPGPRLQARLARTLAMAEERPRFTCARTQVMLSARLDGELSLEESRTLQEHLDGCTACASEAAAYERVSQTVRALPKVTMPLGLERSIRVAIARKQQGILPRGIFEALVPRRLAPGLATAGAALLLAVGFWIGRIMPGAPPSAGTTAAMFQPGDHVNAAPAPAPAPAPEVAARPEGLSAPVTTATRRSPAPSETVVARAPAGERRQVARTARGVARKPARAPRSEIPSAPAEAGAATPPVTHPLPESVANAEEGTGTPAPAVEVASAAPDAVPAPVSAAEVASQGLKEGARASFRMDVSGWRKGLQQDDLEAAAAALRGEAPRRAPGAVVLRVPF